MSKIFSSLRFRLLLLVLLATLPALLLTIYTGHEQRKQVELDALENALQHAEFAAGKNEILIEDTRVTLIALSHAMDFSGNNLHGCGHLFNHLKEVHFPFYSAFYVADLEGNILCTMPNGDVPEDLASCHHYQNLILSDDFVVSQYHICRNSGKGVISMGYPVWDADDHKIGVINVGIDLMWFNDFAIQADLPPDSTLSVIDLDGVILAHYPDPDFWVGKTMPEGPIRDIVLQEESGTTRGYDIDQVERLYAFMPLAGSEESVFLMLGIPTSYAFAEVESTLIRNLVLIGIVTLLALLAAWFLGEAFVVRQINNLVDTTKRLAGGDFSTRTHAVYDRGEFGVLNQSIDEMAQALEDRELERKRTEHEIQEYTANLERSNRDLMDYANIASHDLQEPLRKISNFSDIMLIRYSDEINEQGKDYLNRIRASASRMQKLIIDLLTYSQISTKTQPIEKIDLNEILNQVLIDLELQIEERDAVVNINELPPIHADPVQMHQLLLNLISNSLKFQKPDLPPFIDIHGNANSSQAEEDDVEARYYNEFSVSDNGVGFDEKYLDRIFQPFQRLHKPDEYEGTGMGLAICRKIVERHNGYISAHSQPGEGATFIVKIPVIRDKGNEL
jgi:signal transduction histidine kinase